MNLRQLQPLLAPTKVYTAATRNRAAIKSRSLSRHRLAAGARVSSVHPVREIAQDELLEAAARAHALQGAIEKPLQGRITLWHGDGQSVSEVPWLVERT